jgi:hypothetical protein
MVVPFNEKSALSTLSAEDPVKDTVRRMLKSPTLNGEQYDSLRRRGVLGVGTCSELTVSRRPRPLAQTCAKEEVKSHPHLGCTSALCLECKGRLWSACVPVLARIAACSLSQRPPRGVERFPGC